MSTASTSSKRKRCCKCKRKLSIDSFHRNRRTADGLCNECKRCNCERVKADRLAKPDVHRERARRQYQRNKQKYADRAREWRKANPDKVKEIIRKHGKKSRTAIKAEVMNAYGGPVCACCGESEIMFLTIDHMNNDGNEHRKTIPPLLLYKWLKRNGFPNGYQVLCRNCNWGKHVNGGVCPHQRKPA